jgi:hypothetical protein
VSITYNSEIPSAGSDKIEPIFTLQIGQGVLSITRQPKSGGVWALVGAICVYCEFGGVDGDPVRSVIGFKQGVTITYPLNDLQNYNYRLNHVSLDSEADSDGAVSKVNSVLGGTLDMNSVRLLIEETRSPASESC